MKQLFNPEVWKDSKWYWFVPIVWIYYIRKMAAWTLNHDEFIIRGWRYIIIQMFMFPTIIAGFYIGVLIYHLL